MDRPIRSGRRSARHRGFALLAVLWVMTGVAALALAVSLVARDAVATAQNRVDLARAAWLAEGCLERARASVGKAISGHSASPGDAAWWTALEAAVANEVRGTDVDCQVNVHAAGSAIDVATAGAELLRGTLLAAGIPEQRGDSLVDALLDWRDSDDVPRPHGAERAWYSSVGRHLPRNAPPADVRELARVRGFESIAGLDTLFNAEPGRIALNHAPLVVLRALPGFTDETADRIAERRVRGESVRDLISLLGELSPASREALAARYAEVAALTTAEPDAWVVTSRASSGVRGVTAVVEVRLVRAGNRAAITRRRTWIA